MQKEETLTVYRIPLKDIIEGNNIRVSIDKKKVEELSQSIKSHGLLEPIGVLREDGVYKLIYGFHRFHAYKKLQEEDKGKYSTIEAKVYDKIENIPEIQLIENFQRIELSPEEIEATIYKIMQEGSYKQDELARRVGKDKSYISKILKSHKNRMILKEIANEEQIKKLKGFSYKTLSGLDLKDSMDLKEKRKILNTLLKRGVVVTSNNTTTGGDGSVSKKVKKDIKRLEKAVVERLYKLPVKEKIKFYEVALKNTLRKLSPEEQKALKDKILDIIAERR